MADGKVGVQQAVAPDRYIDNGTYTQDDGTTVYRQRIEDPELMAVLRDVAEGLNKFGVAFDAAGRLRVNPDQTGVATGTLPASVSGTLTTVTGVTTVSSLTNLNLLGGVVGATTGLPAALPVNQLAVAQRMGGIVVS